MTKNASLEPAQTIAERIAWLDEQWDKYRAAGDEVAVRWCRDKIRALLGQYHALECDIGARPGNYAPNPARVEAGRKLGKANTGRAKSKRRKRLGWY